ncbi:MAG TPA: hypothetical protein VLR49_01405, partial [Ferruginibacter sp.]|nr:hypothetical protein [Ferruginibacter sp.]
MLLFSSIILEAGRVYVYKREILKFTYKSRLTSRDFFCTYTQVSFKNKKSKKYYMTESKAAPKYSSLINSSGI